MTHVIFKPCVINSQRTKQHNQMSSTRTQNLFKSFLVEVSSSSWHYVNTKDARNGLQGDRRGEFAYVFKSYERGFGSSLHKLQVFFVRFEYGFVTVIVPKFINVASDAFNECASSPNFPKRMLHVEEDILSGFWANCSSTHKRVNFLARAILANAPVPPFLGINENEGVVF